MSTPTVVLVHGAFAESASWKLVIEQLHEKSLKVVAVANPLRSLAGDAAYVRDTIASLEGPVVLVGHSYGGMVITEAAAGNDAVQALVYVSAFAPDTGETAFDLSGKFPGSTLGAALGQYPLADGGTDLYIRQDLFHDQFAADVPAGLAAFMAATQRPVTQGALTDPLAAETPAWKIMPSWFVFGDEDRNIPAELHRFVAERAASRGTRELAGVAHAPAATAPAEVTAAILDAIASTAAADAAA
jgi:pimeloyl-ACP methyl ester carboxylesterase